MPHPNETRLICEAYLKELAEEQEKAKRRSIGPDNIYFDDRYALGAAKGLEWAEKWFRQHFGHFLKED